MQVTLTIFVIGLVSIFAIMIKKYFLSALDKLKYFRCILFLGNEAWVKELKWSGKTGFNAADVKPWLTQGDSLHSGDVRTYKEFTFLRIFEAGHMVPYDQPRPSLDFFNR